MNLLAKNIYQKGEVKECQILNVNKDKQQAGALPMCVERCLCSSLSRGKSQLQQQCYSRLTTYMGDKQSAPQQTAEMGSACTHHIVRCSPPYRGYRAHPGQQSCPWV